MPYDDYSPKVKQALIRAMVAATREFNETISDPRISEDEKKDAWENFKNAHLSQDNFELMSGDHLQMLTDAIAYFSMQEQNELLTLIQRLLTKKTEAIWFTNSQEENLLHLAAKTGNLNLLQFAIEQIHLPSDQASEQNRPPLNHYINQLDSKLMTPLHMAVRSGDLKTVASLINHGASPTIKKYKSTPAPIEYAEVYAKTVTDPVQKQKQALITQLLKLTIYMNQINGRVNANQNYARKFLGFTGKGYSAQEKQAAAKALYRYLMHTDEHDLNAVETALKTHTKCLLNGELGKLYKDIIKLKPIQSRQKSRPCWPKSK